MTLKQRYRYSYLTAALSDKASPLRRHFDTRYPNKAPLQATYREAAGPLLVDKGDANPGTLGAAFDFAVRFMLDPANEPSLAYTGSGYFESELHVIGGVVSVAQRTAQVRSAPLEEDHFRACWVLALCTEAFRVGALPPGSPLVSAMQTGPLTPDTLMALATPDALRQLRVMHTLAVDKLIPHLPQSPSQLALGPTFDGSRLCSADADLIADGLLLEVKTRLGTLNRHTGVRSDTVSLIDLYQLLGYLLFDRSDSFAIREVGFYSGRYGNLTKWDVKDFLNTLAGEEVLLDVEREHVWQLLGGS